jgi:hypothetical protein
MKLHGLGDPSGVGEGFAYYKHSTATQAASSKKSIVSTDSDLRKISAVEAKRLLVAMGVTYEQVWSSPLLSSHVPLVFSLS